MKTNGFDVSGDVTVQGDIKVGGRFSISTKTENDYIIGLPRKSKPNWFQRLLYKILGFEVVKCDGSD